MCLIPLIITINIIRRRRRIMIIPRLVDVFVTANTGKCVESGVLPLGNTEA